MSTKKNNNRKYGRNKIKCAKYAAEHRRTKNNPKRKLRNPERTPHKYTRPAAWHKEGSYAHTLGLI